MRLRVKAVFLIFIFYVSIASLHAQHAHQSASHKQGENVSAPLCLESEASGLARFVKTVLSILTLGMYQPFSQSSCVPQRVSVAPESSGTVENSNSEKLVSQSPYFLNRVWEGAKKGVGRLMALVKTSISSHLSNGGKAVLNHREPSNRSIAKCYRHVKFLIKKMGCASMNSLNGAQAKNAGSDLKGVGYREIALNSPYESEVNDVVVYQCGKHGHIEMRVPDGFASDFLSPRAHPCKDFKVYRKNQSECHV